MLSAQFVLRYDNFALYSARTFCATVAATASSAAVLPDLAIASVLWRIFAASTALSCEKAVEMLEQVWNRYGNVA